MSVYMSAIMNLYISVHMNVHIDIHINVYISIHMNLHISVHINEHVSAYMNVHISAHMNVMRTPCPSTQSCARREGKGRRKAYVCVRGENGEKKSQSGKCVNIFKNIEIKGRGFFIVPL